MSSEGKYGFNNVGFEYWLNHIQEIAEGKDSGISLRMTGTELEIILNKLKEYREGKKIEMLSEYEPHIPSREFTEKQKKRLREIWFELFGNR